jgi:hypothetical protein
VNPVSFEGGCLGRRGTLGAERREDLCLDLEARDFRLEGGSTDRLREPFELSAPAMSTPDAHGAVLVIERCGYGPAAWLTV